MNRLVGLALSIVLCSLLLDGCASYQVVPEELQGRVNHALTIEQVRDRPDLHQGQIVAWGGTVRSVSRVGDAIHVEFTYLPLDPTLRPLPDPAAAKGGFIGIDAAHHITQPERLEPGALVTVLGEVWRPMQGGAPPTLRIRDLTLWDRYLKATPYPPGSPFKGSRPFVFWEGQRVAAE
ncbi:MAG: Slp family lipoprotein [Nitrospira sp.]|nr:Slp family lipoprotein [Nitrospira sp.]